jgi:hypothetical protein
MPESNYSARESKPMPDVLRRFAWYLRKVMVSQTISRDDVVREDNELHPEGKFAYIDIRQFQYDMHFLLEVLRLLLSDEFQMDRPTREDYRFYTTSLGGQESNEVDPIFPFLLQLTEQTSALPPQTGSWMLDLLARWKREQKNPLTGKIVYHEVRTRPREREWDFEVGGLDTPDQAELGLIDALFKALSQNLPVYLTLSRSKPRQFLPYLLVNSSEGWCLVGDEVTGVPGTASEVVTTRVYPWGLVESAQILATESGRSRAPWHFERKSAEFLRKNYVEIFGNLMGERVHEVELTLTGSAARWSIGHLLYPGQPDVVVTRGSSTIQANLVLRVRDLREAVRFCFLWPGEVCLQIAELAVAIGQELEKLERAYRA